MHASPHPLGPRPPPSVVSKTLDGLVKWFLSKSIMPGGTFTFLMASAHSSHIELRVSSPLGLREVASYSQCNGGSFHPHLYMVRATPTTSPTHSLTAYPHRDEQIPPTPALPQILCLRTLPLPGAVGDSDCSGTSRSHPRKASESESNVC